MHQQKLFLNSSGPTLEACLELPPLSYPCPGVVLCHPHPLYGGDMYNDVVIQLVRALAEEGIASLRFNFRGVGLSQGTYTDGIGEREDALAALEYLAGRAEIDSSKLGICGYSFGGMVTLPVGASSGLVRAVAAVSPVVPKEGLDIKKPWFIVCGDEDNVTPAVVTQQMANKFSGPGTVNILSGADHFWGRQLQKMSGLVSDFFVRFLKGV